VVSFPEMVRTTSGLGEVRYVLGDRLVDRYLEFAAGRACILFLPATWGPSSWPSCSLRVAALGQRLRSGRHMS
jgi:hypothetical protein